MTNKELKQFTILCYIIQFVAVLKMTLDIIIIKKLS